MKRIWKAALGLSDWNQNKRKPYRLFLLINTLLFALPGFAAAAVVCLILGCSWYDTVTAIVIAAGAPGMVIGYLGGALYLMRME